MKGITITNSELINYEQQSSNSNNYSLLSTSSSPDSFPVLMENGIIVKYDLLEFSTKVIEERTAADPFIHNS